MFDAIKAGKRVGAIYKEPTITPTLDQVKSMNLKKMWRSPNGAMRAGWNGDTLPFYNRSLFWHPRNKLKRHIDQPRHHPHPRHGHGVLPRSPTPLIFTLPSFPARRYKRQVLFDRHAVGGE